MKIHELTGETRLMEAREAPLFHGLHAHYAITAFMRDRLEGKTEHSSRNLMVDGGEKPYAVRGLCLSKSFKVSSEFGSVIFEFDQSKLSSRFRIIPVSDMFFAGRGHADGSGGHEAEEFLVGNISPLSKYLIAIHVQKDRFEQQYRNFGKPPVAFIDSPLVKFR